MGQAVVFRQYLDNCADTKDQYLQAEAQAQQKKMGFWNQPDPICMPWDFRRNQCIASSPVPTSTPKPTPRAKPGTLTPSASYPPPCVKRDCNCSDFRDQQDAQRVLDDPNYPNDPFGLDGPIGSGSTGVPGKTCESLPARP